MYAMHNEVKIMKQLLHDNVIEIFDYEEEATIEFRDGTTEEVFYVAMELAKGGVLIDFLLQTKEFGEDISRYYFLQLLDALNYMHSKGISHRDLKPDNLLLDKKFNLKVADFGFATKEGINLTKAGTKQFQAPEIHHGKEYIGKVADIFSAGAILFQMVTGYPPYIQARSNDDFYKNICKNRYDVFWKLHRKILTKKKLDLEFSEAFIDLISWMLNPDPVCRPSLAEIKEHEWCQGYVPSKYEVRDEFKTRTQIIEDAEEEQKNQPIPSGDVDKNIYEQHRVHRGIGEAEEVKRDVEREVQPYIEEFEVYTQFFSISSLDELFSTLTLFAQKIAVEFKFFDDAYSSRLTVIDKEHEESEIEKLIYDVNILKVEDRELYCVEAIKIAGDDIQFNQQYNKLKGYFGGHVNAKRPDLDM